MDPAFDEDITLYHFALYLMFELSTELKVIIAPSYFLTLMLFVMDVTRFRCAYMTRQQNTR